MSIFFLFVILEGAAAAGALVVCAIDCQLIWVDCCDCYGNSLILVAGVEIWGNSSHFLITGIWGDFFVVGMFDRQVVAFDIF